MREEGEFVRIGDNIKVTWKHIGYKRKVRIVVEAPKDIPIHREEVYQAIQRERKAVDAQQKR